MTTCAKVAAVMWAIGYAALTVLLCVLAFYDATLVSAAIAMLFAVLLTVLYYLGLRKEKECHMVPFLVVELILRVMVSFLVAGLWLASTLSVFDMVSIKSPTDSLTGSEYGFAISLVSTLMFAAYVWTFFPFFRAYRRVKKLNDRRRMCANECSYMKLSFTARPTAL
ncbi:hypothetical protein AAVH_07101 [Aphelenchoides avenae]|nr:hypothetical protein AAVH_07101 [Aphelenchus avenae]